MTTAETGPPGREDLDVLAYLPEISQISDEALRQAVIDIWQELWAASSWATVLDVAVGPDIHYPHLPHNRAIIRIALAVADIWHDEHGIEIDRDQLIAAAALQDASKLVEYAPAGDGRVVMSDLGQNLPHAFWVAHLALNHGLSHELCEVLLNHTPQSAKFPRTLIGKILYWVDQLDVIGIHGDRWRKDLFITK
jgi:hypothetical protein